MAKRKSTTTVFAEGVFVRGDEKRTCYRYDQVSGSDEQGITTGSAVYVPKRILDLHGTPKRIRVTLSIE